MGEALTQLDGGVVPPVCTPLTPERELDVPSLERLAAFLIENGVHGLFVTGSTGEVAYLPDETRYRALEVVVGVAAGQVPVLAGVIDTATARVVEHAKAARKAGADALVATAPFYVPTHPVEFPDHFRAVRAAVDLPLIAYDIPVSVGHKLPVDVVLALTEDGTIDAVKDSSGDLDGLRTLLESPVGVRAFSGSEVLADVGLFLGAHGLVPGLGNVDPAGYLRLYEAARRGDWAAAAAEQTRLRALFRIIHVGDGRMGRYSSAMGAFKEGLVARGVIASGTTSTPMTPLNDTERDAVRSHLAEAGLL